MISNGKTRESTVVFLQFGYRIENKIFTRALGELLRAQGSKALFLIDNQVPENAKGENFEIITVKKVRLKPRRSAKENPRHDINSAELRPLSVSDLRMSLYRLKLDVVFFRNWASKVFSAYSLLKTRRAGILCFVGIEPEGVVTASLLSILFHRSYYYCSMELGSELPLQNPLIRKIANRFLKRVVQKARAITVQDLDRAEGLKKQFPVSADKILLLPVGTTDGKISAKTRFLHDKFSIPHDKRIILYAGSIREWACVRELARSATSWPDQYCFVIHGFVPHKNDPYFQSVMAYVDENKVFLSTDIVDWEKLDVLLASADLSIAAYAMTDDNTRLISSSSNKLASYARCGLPLLISHSDNVKRMFDKVRWGETFFEYSDIPSAIDRIVSDYEGYRYRCYQAFDAFYDLNRLGEQFALALNSNVDNR